MEYTNPAEADRKTVEQAIRDWREARDARLELDRKAAKLKSVEDVLKSFLLEAFKQQKLEGMLIGGKVTGLTTKNIPIVEDKEKFLNYMRETGELDLLEFRLSAAAVRVRAEEGVEVPGIGEMETYDLFNRKA